MYLAQHAKGILLLPKQEWPIIDSETTSTAQLWLKYILPLAAIGPLAFAFGMSVVGVFVPFLGTYRASLDKALTIAVVHYVEALATTYIYALIVNILAPTFAGKKSENQALRVVAYAYTANFLVGIFAFLPALSRSALGVLDFLGLLTGLYSLYLLYLGLPILMKVPREKVLTYTAVVLVLTIVVHQIIGIVDEALISYPVPDMPRSVPYPVPHIPKSVPRTPTTRPLRAS